jgi:dTDP-4-dehydrorhamnose reductase
VNGNTEADEIMPYQIVGFSILMGEEFIQEFNDGHINAKLSQECGNFNPNEAAPNNDDSLRQSLKHEKAFGCQDSLRRLETMRQERF